MSITMSFPLMESMDFSEVQPRKGWTKKKFLEAWKECKELHRYQLSAKVNAIDLLIETLRARSTQLATLPPIYREVSYEYFRTHGCVSSGAAEEKKRSRLEWEDAVRTRTGKRPRRMASPSSCTQSAKRTGHRTSPEEVTRCPLPSVIEQDIDNYPRTVTATRTAPRKRQPVISSTPANPKVNAFAVPTTCVTRSRRAPAARLRPRPFRKEEAIFSAGGSPLLNVFSLKAAQLPLTASEMRFLGQLSAHVGQLYTQ